MKFNGTIFSKPQQDQLKENIGNELEKVSAKIDEVDARTKLKEHSFDIGVQSGRNQFVNYVRTNIANISFIKDHNGTIYKNIEKYADAVSMSKIIANYDTYGRIDSIIITTMFVKTNNEHVYKRDFVLKKDGVITVGNNIEITTGTFKIYSY